MRYPRFTAPARPRDGLLQPPTKNPEAPRLDRGLTNAIIRRDRDSHANFSPRSDENPLRVIRGRPFGGGVANTLLSQHLVPGQNVKVDNLCIRFPTSMKLRDVESFLNARLTEEIRPAPDEAAIENLKFSECLPSHVAGEVFSARFNDPEAIATIRNEPKRVVVG